MIKRICLLIFVVALLSGCSNKKLTIEGYVIDISNDQVTLSTHYINGDEIYSLASFKLTNSIELAEGSKVSSNHLKQGHYVTVNATGNIEDSLPFITKALNIKINNSNENELLSNIQTALTTLELNKLYFLREVIEDGDSISVLVEYLDGNQETIKVNKKDNEIIEKFNR